MEITLNRGKYPLVV